jgi:hypothetical protein
MLDWTELMRMQDGHLANLRAARVYTVFSFGKLYDHRMTFRTLMVLAATELTWPFRATVRGKRCNERTFWTTSDECTIGDLPELE